MNKRVLFPFLVLFVLFDLAAAGVAVWWFVFRKPAETALFSKLPERTVAVLWAPNLSASLERWKSTSLYQIWKEPEMQALLAKPLAKFESNPDVDLLKQVAAIPGARDIFLAVIDLQPEQAIVFGLRIVEKKDQDEAAIIAVEERLKDLVPEGISVVENLDGLTLRGYRSPKGGQILTTSSGEWKVWGTTPAAVSQTIRTLTGMAEPGPSLENSAAFRKIAGNLPKDRELVGLLNFEPIRGSLKGMLTGVPNAAEMAKSIESLESFGFTVRFDGEQLRETFCVGYTAPPTSQPALKGEGVRFISPETILYYQGTFDAGSLNFDALSSQAMQAPGLEGLANLAAGLQAAGIDGNKLGGLLGPEMSVQLDWGKGMPQPKLFGRVEVKNRAEAQSVLATIAKPEVSGMTWRRREPGAGSDLEIYVTPAQAAFMQPVFAVGLDATSLYAGMGALDVERFSKRTGKIETGSGSDTPLLAEVSSGSFKRGNMFVMVDSRALFTQVYGMLKSALTVMNMFGGTGSSAIPLDLLPPTEVIAKHLQPFILTSELKGDVAVTECSGPITITPTLVLSAGSLAGAAMSGELLDNPLISELLQGLSKGH